MIVFDLKCEQDHVFEAWFASSEAFESQRVRSLIPCAFCGSTNVVKAVMAPRLNAKGNARGTVTGADINLLARIEPASDALTVSNAPAVQESPAGEQQARIHAMMTALAAAQAKALSQSAWVGKDFANRARAMHYGEEDHAPIHGQAAPDEAAALIEEGVAVAPLPFPVIPPEAQN